MAVCPNCKAKVADDATSCSTCGKAIPASSLEDIQTHTTGWQWFVIAVTTALLIVIGFTFYDAEEREDRAAQQVFGQPIANIVRIAAAQTGLGNKFGIPDCQFVAKPKEADVVVTFAKGPLNQAQASMYGQAVAARLAQAYVRKGYMPRHLRVVVAGNQPGGRAVYGQAIYNGNIEALGWEPASN